MNAPASKTVTKFKTSMRGLDIIQTVYALLLALGLREVFLAFYNVFLQQRASSRSDNIVLAMLLFINIILLSVRFFWVPRNLRRLYFVLAYRDNRLNINKAEVASPYETAAHICIILMHGALYFLLCKEFDYFVFVATSNDSYTKSVFSTYVFLHVFLLILNGLWILYLNEREDNIRSTLGPSEILSEKSESRLWSRSNLIFSLLAVGPLAVLSSCESDLAVCLSVAFSGMQSPYAMLPTSAYNLAFAFENTTAIFSGFGYSRDFLLALWALSLLGANSIIDLVFTASYYINLEDVERETTYSEPTQ